MYKVPPVRLVSKRNQPDRCISFYEVTPASIVDNFSLSSPFPAFRVGLFAKETGGRFVSYLGRALIVGQRSAGDVNETSNAK